MASQLEIPSKRVEGGEEALGLFVQLRCQVDHTLFHTRKRAQKKRK